MLETVSFFNATIFLGWVFELIVAVGVFVHVLTTLKAAPIE
jgi:hypothetical protein